MDQLHDVGGWFPFKTHVLEVIDDPRTDLLGSLTCARLAERIDRIVNDLRRLQRYSAFCRLTLYKVVGTGP